MRGRTYKYMVDNIYYPFGYGLHYGQVDYSNLRLKANKKGATVTATLTNSSKHDICETVQLYVTAPGAGVSAPLEQLVAFRRVDVAAGATVDVTFDVKPELLMTVGEDGLSRLTRGLYTFTVSGAAPSTRTQQLLVPMVSAQAKI